MAEDKTAVTPVRDLGKQASRMGLPKMSGPVLHVSSTGTDHKQAINYRQLGENEGYPRGYNPQQMGEVREAENTGRLALFSNSAMEDGRKHAEHEKALVRENIARSRVNPMEIPTETPHAGETPLEIRVQPHQASGQHFHDTRKVVVQPKHTSDDVLLHEMGHEAMETDEEANRTEESITSTQRKALERLVVTRGATLDISPRQVSIHGVSGMNSSEITQVKKTRNKFQDIRSGYREGYANKYAADNYVQDPRTTRRQGEWDITTDTSNPYTRLGFAGQYAKSGTRINHFATGYLAAQAPIASLEHPWVKEQVADMESKADPNRWKYTAGTNSSGEYTYTGGDILKAAAAARGATDAEIRGTAPQKRAARKPRSSTAGRGVRDFDSFFGL